MNQVMPTELKSTETYILYRFQGELYGTPLHMVREVVPFQTPRSVPNTKKNYLGIVHLRGEIVGVIDLRVWFQDEKSPSRRPTPRALIVVDSHSGVMAASVDTIEGVCQLDSKDIESPKGMPGTFASGGMIGIGKFRHGLATLLDLRALCSAIDIATERKERWAS